MRDAPFPLPMERASVLLAPVARWTALRKARLLQAIQRGIVSEEAAMRAHDLDPEEIEGWRRHYRREGIAALHLLTTIEATRRV